MAGPSNSNKGLLHYTGHRHLRQRLVLSVLSGRSVKIDGIRLDEVEVGLRDYEISFLRLLEKITNGSTISISYTGTTLLFHPGLLPGGSYTHACPLTRPIGYYLSPLIPLSIFGKKAIELKLTGITGQESSSIPSSSSSSSSSLSSNGPAAGAGLGLEGEGELSVDLIRTVTLPHLHLFGVIDGLELGIKKRGAAPFGGGEVVFKCPVVRNVKTLNFVERGRIRRIRGIAYSTRVSPQFANRLVEASRSILNRYIPDIYLYTDVYKGEESGKSPGYGLSLMSLSTTGGISCAETISVPPPTSHSNGNSNGSGKAITTTQANGDGPRFQTPEDLALHASRLLLEEISKGGCVDGKHQWLVMLLMVLGREDVGVCRMGGLTEHSVQFLRDLFDFFQVKFKVSPAPPSSSSKVKAEGSGNPNAQEDDMEDDEDDAEEEGENADSRYIPDEVLVSCLGIGYGNINKSMA